MNASGGTRQRFPPHTPPSLRWAGVQTTKPVGNHKKKHHPSGWCFFRVLRSAPFIAASRDAGSNKKRYPIRPDGVSFFIAACVSAGSNKRSAAEHAKKTPPGWVVFLFVIAHRFCCLHSRPPQGRGSVRGEPLTGSPTRVQSPARRRSLLRSKSAAPKKKDTHMGVFLFLERATRLELATSTLARSRSTR